MNTAKGVSELAPSPFGVAQKRSLSFEDDFKTEQLRPEWQWPAGHTPVVARGTGNCKGIVLGSDRQSDREPLGAVIARATLSADYTAETAVCLNGGATATSGLAAYGDGNNALGVAVSSSALELWERRNGQRRVVQTMSNVSGMVYIRMSATEGHRFIFSFSSDGNSWRQIGPEMDGLFIPPWDRSVRVALFSQASTGAGAAFEFLRITPTGADMARQQ
jgi:beta-xylosidase